MKFLPEYIRMVIYKQKKFIQFNANIEDQV